MKENIKYLFKNLRSYLQNTNSSYEKHHDQYDQNDSLINHRDIYQKYHNDVLINNPNNKVIDFLDQHILLQSMIKIAFLSQSILLIFLQDCQHIKIHFLILSQGQLMPQQRAYN